jgi:hypothetical protein
LSKIFYILNKNVGNLHTIPYTWFVLFITCLVLLITCLILSMLTSSVLMTSCYKEAEVSEAYKEAEV